MKSFSRYLAWCPLFFPLVTAQVANVTLVAAATGFEDENTAFIYSRSPLLVANDKGAADGGFRVFSVSKTTPFTQKSHQKTGRSKIAVPVYDVDGRDVIVNVPAPDSLFRVFDVQDFKEIESGEKTQLGDWSTACVWRSQKSGENYLFLFGKKMVVQFLVRGKNKNVEILEVSENSKLHIDKTDRISDSDIRYTFRGRVMHSFLQWPRCFLGRRPTSILFPGVRINCGS